MPLTLQSKEFPICFNYRNPYQVKGGVVMIPLTCPICKNWVSSDAVLGFGFCPNCGNQGQAGFERHVRTNIAANEQREKERPRLRSKEEINREREASKSEWRKECVRREMKEASFDFFPCYNCGLLLDKNLLHFGSCPYCKAEQTLEKACKEFDRCPDCFDALEKGKCEDCIDYNGLVRTVVAPTGWDKFFGAQNKEVQRKCVSCEKCTGNCGRCQGTRLYFHCKKEPFQYRDDIDGWRMHKYTVLPREDGTLNNGVFTNRPVNMRVEPAFNKTAIRWLMKAPMTPRILFNIISHCDFQKPEATPGTIDLLLLRIRKRAKWFTEHDMKMMTDKLKNILEAWRKEGWTGRLLLNPS